MRTAILRTRLAFVNTVVGAKGVWVRHSGSATPFWSWRLSVNPQQIAQVIVRSLLYVTVATTSSVGEPWNSPVYSAYDDRGNFYWTSSPLAQHSRNIDQNGRAFLAIYDSMVPAGKGEGVYIEAT